VRDNLLFGGVADTAGIENYYVGGLFTLGFFKVCIG
jgi:hypothetical protein